MTNQSPRADHAEWRKALCGDRDIMDVLTESFGDKYTARLVLSFLATYAEIHKVEVKVARVVGFFAGVAITLLIGAIVKVFA